MGVAPTVPIIALFVKGKLEGLQGVTSVDKGFRFHKEINTVYYEADKITIEEMKAASKAAGTYNGISED